MNFNFSFFVVLVLVTSCSGFGLYYRKTLLEDSNCAAAREVFQSIKKVAWGPDHVHPINVCVGVTNPVEACTEAKNSTLELLVTVNNVTTTFPKTFTVADLKGDEYCHAFDECEIARAFQGRNITGATIGLTIQFLTNGSSTKTKSQHWFSLDYMSYTFSKPRVSRVLKDKDYRLHAMHCKYSDCNVTSLPRLSAAKESLFRIAEGQNAPQCTDENSTETVDPSKMFSIISFICKPGKCPDSFKAVRTGKATGQYICYVGFGFLH